MGNEGKNAIKLEIELVPSSAWWKNLRAKITEKEWDMIRHETYLKYGYMCGICGSKGRMNCHELWKYNDISHVQKLVGFIALCDMCHHVKHIGLAGILASEGKLDYGEVVRHFMRVNSCTSADFEEHKSREFMIWEERSRNKWKLDLGEAFGKKGELAGAKGQSKLDRFD